MNKEVYFLCEGDTIRFTPTDQIGYINKIHEDEDGTHYELILRQPDKKLWARWEDVELLYAMG
jgi:hypothetical protein